MARLVSWRRNSNCSDSTDGVDNLNITFYNPWKIYTIKGLAIDGEKMMRRIKSWRRRWSSWGSIKVEGCYVVYNNNKNNQSLSRRKPANCQKLYGWRASF